MEKVEITNEQFDWFYNQDINISKLLENVITNCMEKRYSLLDLLEDSK